MGQLVISKRYREPREALEDFRAGTAGPSESPARFVCAVALAEGDAIAFEARGTVEGTVATRPSPEMVQGTGRYYGRNGPDSSLHNSAALPDQERPAA